MANEAEFTDEELALARARARIRLEQETAQVPEESPADWSAGKWGEIALNSVTELPGKLINTADKVVTGLYGLGKDVLEEGGAMGGLPVNYVNAISKKMYDNPATTARIAAAGAVSAIPGGALLQPAVQAGIGPILQSVGWEEPPSYEETATNAIQDMALLGGGRLINSTAGSPYAKAKIAGAGKEALLDPATNIKAPALRGLASAESSGDLGAVNRALTFGGAKDAAANAVENIGKEIGSVYKSVPETKIPVSEITKGQGFLDLENAISDPLKTATGQRAAKGALKELSPSFNRPAIGPEQAYSVNELWQIRKNLDKSIRSFNGPATEKTLALRDARAAVNDAIKEQIAMTPGGPEIVQNLLDLNNRYNAANEVWDLYNNAAATSSPFGLRAGAKFVSGLGSNIVSGLGGESGIMAGFTSLNAPLPRNSKVSEDPNSSMVIRNAAAQMGVPPEVFDRAPAPVKREIMGQVAKNMPGLFEPTPDGYTSVMDNKFSDPMERSMYTKSALEALASGEIDPKDEPRIMGGLIERGEYTPIKTPIQSVAAPKPPVQFSLSDLDMALNDGLYSMKSEQPAETDSLSMLRQAAKYPAAY